MKSKSTTADDLRERIRLKAAARAPREPAKPKSAKARPARKARVPRAKPEKSSNVVDLSSRRPKEHRWQTLRAIAGSRSKRLDVLASAMFKAATPLPGVVPEGYFKKHALDQALKRSTEAAAMALDEMWENGLGFGMTYGAFAEGQMFLGYPYLSELAQRPEFRVVSETVAEEATRKFVKITAKGDDKKADKVKALEDEFDRLKVPAVFQKCAQYDGLMGRSHLFVDYDGAEGDERAAPIDPDAGANAKLKIKQGALARLTPVEAVWTYPTTYNTNDPTNPSWYNPEVWFVMAQKIHSSRLLTFVSREVPDMLKPAYSFGGLSASQMIKPYVDIWLRNRQSVAELINAFSVMVLKGDLSALMEAGEQEVQNRLEAFARFRSNMGVMLVDKNAEDLANVSAPLGTLDALVAQSQEHICAAARIPTVKLLGIQPSGMNASSEGEIRTFYDTIKAYQIRFLGPRLDKVFKLAQINLWGEADPDLTYRWEPLWELDEKGMAEVRKIDADTDAVLVELGAVDAHEVRERVAKDPDSPHASLDLEKEIEPPGPEGGEGEEGGGLTGKGGVPRGIGLGQGGGLSGGHAFGGGEDEETDPALGTV